MLPAVFFATFCAFVLASPAVAASKDCSKGQTVDFSFAQEVSGNSSRHGRFHRGRRPSVSDLQQWQSFFKTQTFLKTQTRFITQTAAPVTKTTVSTTRRSRSQTSTSAPKTSGSKISTKARTSTTTPRATTTTKKAAATTRAATTTRAAATQTTVASGSLQALALKAHNDVRALHNAEALVWNQTLANVAQQWSDRCVFEHGGGAAIGAGENLAAHSDESKTIADGIQMWIDEEPDYDPTNPVASHWTQMIWRSTTQIGCAETLCDPLKTTTGNWKGKFWTCEYLAAGNVFPATYFTENVH